MYLNKSKPQLPLHLLLWVNPTDKILYKKQHEQH